MRARWSKHCARMANFPAIGANACCSQEARHIGDNAHAVGTRQRQQKLVSGFGQSRSVAAA
jgi:hypothetical protein